MGKVNEQDLTAIIEHIGNNIHIPQMVQHFDRSMIFDTEERMVGQGVDSKPLYQKTIQATTPSASTNNWMTISSALGSNVGGDNIVDIVTCVIDWDGANGRNVSPTYFNAINNFYALTVVQGYFAFNFEGSWFAERPIVFTVCYTKTTDSPVTYIVDDEYEPRVEHCDTFDQNNPTDVTVTFNLGSGSQLIDADELVLYQASSGSFVTVNTAKYRYTFTSIWLDPTAGFMNSTTLAETPMRIVFNKNSIPVKVLDFILPVILK